MDWGFWGRYRALCVLFHTRIELVFHEVNGIAFPDELLKRMSMEGSTLRSSHSKKEERAFDDFCI